MAKKPFIDMSVDISRTLCHVALLAAWEGNPKAAERIFNALQKIKPKASDIRICRAMVYACQDRYADAIKILKDVLRDKPNNVSAKGLLGFVIFTTGERGWQRLLEEVVADGSDQASMALAKQVLSEHREYQTPSAKSGLMPTPHIIYE
jgi:cytochrome c-type biogenesis protein CcmH/NrfG